jgi:universal stress protein A
MVPELKRLLVPTDFSPTSARALEYAGVLAKQFGASLHLLHVVAFPMQTVASPEGYWVELSGFRQRMREDAERLIAQVAASLSGVQLTTEVVEGQSPARAIVEAATERASHLIVMGTHGHGGVTHLLLGSVAERVVRTAPCPVLTVSSAGADAHRPTAEKTG